MQNAVRCRRAALSTIIFILIASQGRSKSGKPLVILPIACGPKPRLIDFLPLCSLGLPNQRAWTLLSKPLEDLVSRSGSEPETY